MKTRNYNRYSYNELFAVATKPDAAQIDVDTLGEWFSAYGEIYWNGEYYDADGYRIRPVYDWGEEADQGEIVHYELY